MLKNVLNELQNDIPEKNPEKYLEMLGSYLEQIKSDVSSKEKRSTASFKEESGRKVSKRSVYLTEEAVKKLKANENVEAITYGNVYYTAKFKQKAVTDYLAGKDPDKIFEDAGFNLEELSTRFDYASSTIQRWRRELVGQKPQAPLHSYKGLVQRNRFLELENQLLRKIIWVLEKE